jgi:hypothetical protein
LIGEHGSMAGEANVIWDPVRKENRAAFFFFFLKINHPSSEI